jgi:hypothetical protein
MRRIALSVPQVRQSQCPRRGEAETESGAFSLARRSPKRQRRFRVRSGPLRTRKSPGRLSGVHFVGAERVPKFRTDRPVFVFLGEDEGCASFALSVERVERLLQTFLRGLSGVNRAAHSFGKRLDAFSDSAIVASAAHQAKEARARPMGTSDLSSDLGKRRITHTGIFEAVFVHGDCVGAAMPRRRPHWDHLSGFPRRADAIAIGSDTTAPSATSAMACRSGSRPRGEVRMAKAAHKMVVDDADGLHEGVDDGRSAELEPATRELL